MKRLRPLSIGLGIVVLWLGWHTSGRADGLDFTIDASWPKPLPNNWVIGAVSGVAVDGRNHVWIVHRGRAFKQPPGPPAPPVIEFDAQGHLIRAWGGPGSGYEWPAQEHGISVDRRGHVWLTSSGNEDRQILEFTREGKFLQQIGRRGAFGGSRDTANFGKPAQTRIDTKANEMFIADGEDGGNRRVIVVNASTGAFKRQWGAYGEPPDDGTVAPYNPQGPLPRQFGVGVHCLRIADDGLVYVCDRKNNRIQVFHENGTFVAEAVVAPETTRGMGSVWDMDFSPDQKFLYVSDGVNQKVWMLRRDRLEVVGSFGDSASGAGPMHSLATDSHGNIYLGRSGGGPGYVQRFSPKSAR
jgi:hypothetical protein